MPMLDRLKLPQSNLSEIFMKNHLKRNWKIVLLHHTHLDIGYTHTQEEVLKIQFQHLETAMDLIDKHKHKPDHCRFRWNPEILWAIEEWVKQASPSEKERFVRLVQEGYIGLDGLYANVLTGLCRPEELMESFQIKTQMEHLTKTPIESAMITDIPGLNWGLVTALAENNIHYLSSGPNRSDRIGYFLKEWGDKPFYWRSPSNQEKVLVFIHGKGYSWFHSGMYAKKNLSRKLNPRRLSRYLKKLEEQNYPYDTIIIRYNIGADNGPPDPLLSNIVVSWNQKYPHMKLEISTTAKALADFSRKNSNLIPEFSGDLTPYWEDGAASTARETAIAREAGERLTQATILSAMMAQDDFQDRILTTWKKTYLFNEHTWGAHNSISSPDHPFVQSQWEWKKQKALNANKDAFHLLEDISHCKLIYPPSYIEKLNFFEKKIDCTEISVVNTHNWPITQVIKINTPYNCISDEQRNFLKTQRLSDGKLAFIATDIPGFGKKNYFLSNIETKDQREKGLISDQFTLKNEFIEVSIDEKWGTVKNISYKGEELIMKTDTKHFNGFIFAKSKWGTQLVRDSSKNVKIEIIDNGPIISSIKITSSAFRTNMISSIISIESISAKIYISNQINRPISRKKEGIYFEFPLSIKNGRVKYDTIFGSAVVDKDQLLGANRNFISATRWIDISNQNYGVSCALLDAPLFKSGILTHDPIRFGPPKLCGWLRKTEYNGIFYSYIMNNYWMTNYKADQPGNTLFRYVFNPHQKFNESVTTRFALEEGQPLLVFNNTQNISKNRFPLVISSKNIIITNVKFDKKFIFYTVRVFNASNSILNCKITVNTDSIAEIIGQNKQNRLTKDILQLEPLEIISLKMRGEIKLTEFNP
ncbi:hypothetical protein NEF87_000820 [Candidatus Lokiarchaeum ossiferum]|uniref:Glycoside hydrolase family 38 N-terminal domain-containing protein n=1 Tax=Candidatus Lokiarchaeum ossiferum TaxID=2951803 RepID=A0ABY6HLZ4_9ARCH|nr:hypothetical protein NEF87_000820 [Candidatus Lokiarchaeum sp. B-35]